MTKKIPVLFLICSLPLLVSCGSKDKGGAQPANQAASGNFYGSDWKMVSGELRAEPQTPGRYSLELWDSSERVPCASMDLSTNYREVWITFSANMGDKGRSLNPVDVEYAKLEGPNFHAQGSNSGTLQIDSFTSDSISGSIQASDENGSVNGTFNVKVCPKN